MTHYIAWLALILIGVMLIGAQIARPQTAVEKLDAAPVIAADGKYDIVKDTSTGCVILERGDGDRLGRIRAAVQCDWFIPLLEQGKTVDEALAEYFPRSDGPTNYIGNRGEMESTGE